VVEIEDMFSVGWMPVILNRMVCFVGARMRIRAVDCARPNVEHTVFVRRRPAELRSVGRDLRDRALRITEKNFAWNERGQFGVNSEGAKPDERTEKTFHIDCHFPYLSFERSSAMRELPGERIQSQRCRLWEAI